MIQSLFSHLDDGARRSEPFPHLFSEAVLPAEMVKDLQASLPWKIVLDHPEARDSNRRINLPVHRVLEDDRIPSLWRSILLDNSSPAAYRAAMSLLAQDPVDTDVGVDLAKIEPARIGRRGVDDFASCDVLMDAQISINTPVLHGPHSVRGVHVDNPRKVFSCLFYLRLPDDDTRGGDLELHRFRGEPGGFIKEAADPKRTDPVATVPYQANTLVAFRNGVQALHAVTPRATSHWHRVFLNIIAEYREPLYDLSIYQTSSS